MSTQISSSNLDGASAATCVHFGSATRLATGAADGTVSIFERASGAAPWSLAATWQAHDASVNQVTYIWNGSKHHSPVRGADVDP